MNCIVKGDVFFQMQIPWHWYYKKTKIILECLLTSIFRSWNALICPIIWRKEIIQLKQF